MKRKEKPSANFLDELENNPNFVARRRAQEVAFAKREAELAQDEASLVRDLVAAGVRVRSVWDLVNTPITPREAMPVLVQHLYESHGPRTLEGIVRALTVRDATGIATKHLVKLYRKVPNDANPNISGLKWAIAQAIAETFEASVLNEVLQLARDSTHVGGRDQLVRSLRRLPRAVAEPLLEEMAADPVLRSAAEKLLRTMRRRKK